MPEYARCNLDGKPLDPRDKVIIETFKIWLQMDDTDRMLAIRLDPEWYKFIMGKSK